MHESQVFWVQGSANFGLIAISFAESVFITQLNQPILDETFVLIPRPAAMLASGSVGANHGDPYGGRMTNEMVNMDGVHVAGNFQAMGSPQPRPTDNGDGTWSYTFTSDTAASYQYKFVNGNAWGTDEGVPAACAVDSNRGITVDGMMGDVSAEACFGNCAACGMTTVRFRVDMATKKFHLRSTCRWMRSMHGILMGSMS